MIKNAGWVTLTVTYSASCFPEELLFKVLFKALLVLFDDSDDVMYCDVFSISAFKILSRLSNTGCVSVTKLAMEMSTNIREMYP